MRVNNGLNLYFLLNTRTPASPPSSHRPICLSHLRKLWEEAQYKPKFMSLAPLDSYAYMLNLACAVSTLNWLLLEIVKVWYKSSSTSILLYAIN